jgi:branched-chain amino acid transport system ATP-binding protein
MQSNGETLLEIKHLSSGYGRVCIVNDVSLRIAAGEILAIIGRNGVGKSTLMKTLIGSISVTTGKIEFLGRDITFGRSASRARLGIGYVPQGRGIFGRMSVAENLALGQWVGTTEGQPNYARTFEFFPILKERLHQRSGSLSGGEQQQLAIGRILVGAPRLILLDEPSEGIQPNIVQEIGRIICRLRNEQNLTVLVVEQNLDLIKAVADRCIVIDKGRVVAYLAQADIGDPDLAKRYLAV